jgi:hypothetical protein
MPNILGGDQFHPAYHPGVKLANNQVIIGDSLYTIVDSSKQGERVECEEVNGMKVIIAAPYPKKVADKLKELRDR